MQVAGAWPPRWQGLRRLLLGARHQTRGWASRSVWSRNQTAGAAGCQAGGRSRGTQVSWQKQGICTARTCIVKLSSLQGATEAAAGAGGVSSQHSRRRVLRCCGVNLPAALQCEQKALEHMPTWLVKGVAKAVCEAPPSLKGSSAPVLYMNTYSSSRTPAGVGWRESHKRSNACHTLQ